MTEKDARYCCWILEKQKIVSFNLLQLKSILRNVDPEFVIFSPALDQNYSKVKSESSLNSYITIHCVSMYYIIEGMNTSQIHFNTIKYNTNQTLTLDVFILTMTTKGDSSFKIK